MRLVLSNLLNRPTGEGQPAGKSVPKCNAERVDVGPRIDCSTRELLGTGEGGSSDKFAMRKFHFSGRGTGRLGQSEVDHLYFHLCRRVLARRQHDVSRFQVTMNQPALGRCDQSARYLNRDLQRSFYL